MSTALTADNAAEIQKLGEQLHQRIGVFVEHFAKIGKHLESFYDLVAGVDKVGALFDVPVEGDSEQGA